MKRLFFIGLILSIVLINACQKEKSFEAASVPSEGTLQSNTTGDCLPKNVAGTYVQGTALNGNTEYIEVTVNVTKAGDFTIYSDTTNGVYFRLVGTFTSVGNTVVRLRGNGTPFAQGPFNYNIKYNGQTCIVSVTFLPTGAGGPSAYTLTGAPAACTGATVAGSYAVGLALNNANTATISVNVTTIGTYNITTTYQGMTFAASGVFTTTGTQNVILIGTGKPTTAGVNNVPITAGTSTCSFPVTVGSPAVGTLNCSPATIGGIYAVATPLTNANTVQIQANATTAGVYGITTNTVNGISFAASGNFGATGVQSVTLTGTGTPIAAGTFTYTVSFGTSTCTFVINCQVLTNDYFPRTANSNWSYEIDDFSSDSIYRTVVPQTHPELGNTYNVFMASTDLANSPPYDSSGYYRRNGGDYFELFDASEFLQYDNPLRTEYTFLKDNVAANTNWKTAPFTGTVTSPPNPVQTFSYRFSNTILQKDVPVTITTSTGTVTYQNVIVVEEKYELRISVNPDTWQDISSVSGYWKSYYAKGVGLIKYEEYDGTGMLVSSVKLRRYQIF